MDIDEPLLLFRAQYLQCVDHDFLTWPPPALLKQQDAQHFLSRQLFSTEKLIHRPPAQYELKVLKTLVAKIEKATGAGRLSANDLTSRLADLDRLGTSQSTLSKQDVHVTYNCTRSISSWQPVVLYESRSRVSGSSYTGHRTWEGALHLASYLISNPSIISGNRVLELGAGTGFLSILCRKYLNAQHVLSTDGDDLVVAEMQKNMRLNNLYDSDSIVARKLWWGFDLLGDWKEHTNEIPFTVVIAADVIYQKEATRALVQALRAIVDMQPNVKIIMSNALRFPDIFEIFRHDCEDNNLSINIINYQMIPPQRQKSLFYSTAMPLQLAEIRNIQADDPSNLN